MTDAIRGVLGTGEIAGSGPAAGTKTGQTTDAGASLPAGGADSANVAQTQSLLDTIGATVGAVPTVNQDQVSAIRQTIANGTYRVDPQQVARQILNSDQSLVGPQSGNE
jgi:negative regulator of flagellin synthesis FlgM